MKLLNMIVFMIVITAVFLAKFIDNNITSKRAEPPEFRRLVTIVDTDGAEHRISSQALGLRGSAVLQDSEGHTVIFHDGKFHHGLEKTHCVKCYQLEWEKSEKDSKEEKEDKN